MSIGMKSKAAVQTELETCIESSDRLFRVELDLQRFDSQIDSIIAEKIRDYYHQRFRDWSVPDLLQLRVCIREKARAEKASK